MAFFLDLFTISIGAYDSGEFLKVRYSENPADHQLMNPSVANLDSKGGLVVPARMRRALGLSPGSLVMLNVQDGMVTIRPAVAVPTERYTRERQAEFALNNAVDAQEYARALQMVREMGLDPAKIPHERPEDTNSGLS